MDHALAQELAKLSLAIQEGRREFDGLKAEKETFLQEREVEATAKVIEALKRSKEAVKEAETNAKLVEELQQIAENVVSDIKAAKMQMQEDRRAFKRATTEAHKQLETKGKELEAEMVKVREEKMRLNGLLNSIRIKQVELKNEQRKTDDKRNMLGVAIKDLKKRGLWQKVNVTGIE